MYDEKKHPNVCGRYDSCNWCSGDRFFLTGKDEAAADTTTKETLAAKVTDTDVRNYLDSKKKSPSAVKHISSFLIIKKSTEGK
ncbi:hypothetical protein BsIDN1_43450 [Bacillus safensis]|uniref:Uncharacterized protein n=1 Tax=Bacillus safensis TaxID=561879 RepID=A0A5S9MB45_BACIA|nr:hypothetical protein BsIDN1_43450 [Bacillus safensis]